MTTYLSPTSLPLLAVIAVACIGIGAILLAVTSRTRKEES